MSRGFSEVGKVRVRGAAGGVRAANTAGGGGGAGAWLRAADDGERAAADGESEPVDGSTRHERAGSEPGAGAVTRNAAYGSLTRRCASPERARSRDARTPADRPRGRPAGCQNYADIL